MKKLLKKKVNVFGKGIPVFAIVILGLALVSAALIPYWGIITGSVIVNQGLFLDGKAWDTIITETWNNEEFTSLESKTFVGVHYLDNGASVDAEVDLVRNCVTSNCDPDVTTEYYLTNLRSGTLVLENKDSSWNVLGTDGIEATLIYTFFDGTFGYDLSATGLNNVEYVLIYYADQPDRFTSWGGAPALELGRATASGGTLSLTGQSIVIPGGLLPYANDWNAGKDANYCANTYGDNYDHCRGAKIWLIPVSDYDGTGNVLKAWNPTTYLFETDMLGWDHLNDALINPVTVPTGTELDFVIVNNFPQMLVPATYEIETKVVLTI